MVVSAPSTGLSLEAPVVTAVTIFGMATLKPNDSGNDDKSVSLRSSSFETRGFAMYIESEMWKSRTRTKNPKSLDN